MFIKNDMFKCGISTFYYGYDKTDAKCIKRAIILVKDNMNAKC